MKNFGLILGLCSMVASGSGCAQTKIVVDGIEIYESYWLDGLERLRPTASYDFDCPADQLEFTLIQRSGRYPSEVGVTGCGRRGRYVNMGYVWVLSTSEDRLAPTVP